jgi:outer membrane receptor protein involved in Fe transport
MGEEIFGLESAEVLKGPSSTLYGESVLGGIVSLRSKVPRPDAFAQVQFTGGSHGFYGPAIDVGASLNRSHTHYARINLLYGPTGSFVNYVNRHRAYVAPALTWDINSDTQLTLLGRYQHDAGHMGFPLPAEGASASRCNRERCIAATCSGATSQPRHLINAGRSLPIENVNQLPRVPNEIYLQLSLLIDLELRFGVEHARALALVRIVQI